MTFKIGLTDIFYTFKARKPSKLLGLNSFISLLRQKVSWGQKKQKTIRHFPHEMELRDGCFRKRLVGGAVTVGEAALREAGACWWGLGRECLSWADSCPAQMRDKPGLCGGSPWVIKTKHPLPTMGETDGVKWGAHRSALAPPTVVSHPALSAPGLSQASSWSWSLPFISAWYPELTNLLKTTCDSTYFFCSLTGSLWYFDQMG